jgi:hypothetical protein
MLTKDKDVDIFIYCVMILLIIIINGSCLRYIIFYEHNVNRVYPAPVLNNIVNINDEFLRVERIINIHFGVVNNDNPNINIRDDRYINEIETDTDITYDYEPVLDDTYNCINI